MDPLARSVVIIGGTAAGTSAAASISRHSPHFRVTLFERGPIISTASCSIPDFIAGTIGSPGRLSLQTPESFAHRYGTRVLTGCTITAIDVTRRRVVGLHQASGEQFSEPWDRLLLATGSIPRRCDIPGHEADNIFVLKTVESAVRLRTFIEEYHPRRALIIGGGLLGVTMAHIFSSCGLTTTLMEQGPHLLPSFDDDMATRVEAAIASGGISVMTNCSPVQYQVRDGLCHACDTTSSAMAIQTDLVLETIGVDPEVSLARDAGIRLGPTGAITTDNHLRTNLWNIFAAGDCIELINRVSGRPAFHPRGSHAAKTGRVAGEQIAGLSSVFPGIVMTTILRFGPWHIGQTGMTAKAAALAGFKTLCVDVTTPVRAPGYDDGSTMTIKLVCSLEGRLLGVQMLGTDGVVGRIQTCALAVQEKVTIKDLSLADLGYSPSLTPLWDPLNIAARAAMKRLGQG